MGGEAALRKHSGAPCRNRRANKHNLEVRNDLTIGMKTMICFHSSSQIISHFKVLFFRSSVPAGSSRMFSPPLTPSAKIILPTEWIPFPQYHQDMSGAETINTTNQVFRRWNSPSHPASGLINLFSMAFWRTIKDKYPLPLCIKC